jgi:hypothetical protein
LVDSVSNLFEFIRLINNSNPKFKLVFILYTEFGKNTKIIIANIIGIVKIKIKNFI